ncbi:MAG TPA: ABC transporter ATP-binding protein [Candidatus Ozemobacteraceae bacterium]|nr:ABC transporter ATP-binding protein [Candidatus Ozemobacteraceae bacterium]
MIRLEEIRKTYKLGIVDVPVLRGVSLHIARGEFVSIMGASGSGKSTLLNILGCLDVPTSGRYLLEDQAVDVLADNALSDLRARFIGFVFQRFHLIKYLSVLDNTKLTMEFINMADREADEAARHWLGRVRMDHRLDHYPHQLSGGERQRVAIARALIKTPKLILADEPTGNLDEAVGNEIIGLFRELNRELGLTIIMVTHSPEIASRTDRIIHIRDGLIQ